MTTSNAKHNLEDRLINFAVIIIEVVNHLPTDRVGNHLGQQLLRSGTSPALNYGEAMGAESRKDFVHKLKIAYKELRETLVCIRMLDRVAYLNENGEAAKECNELIAIFTKSILTAKKNGV